jgi:hypothetical protein
MHTPYYCLVSTARSERSTCRFKLRLIQRSSLARGKDSRNQTANAFGSEFQLGSAIQVATQGILYQTAAESSPGRRNDLRATAFAPIQIELIIQCFPAKLNPAFGTRERSVLRRVRRELVEDKREGQRLSR